MTGLIDDNFKAELNRMEMLSLDGEPQCLYFVADKNSIQDARVHIALEQAERYKADAVFFRIFPEDPNRTPLPQIYIYHDTSISLNEAEYAERHRRLWNAGIVPLIFIFTASSVKVLNCRQEPEVKDGKPVYSPFSNFEEMIAAQYAFATRAISSGTLWDDPSFRDDFVLEKTAYYKLLHHLKLFREDLLKQKILSEQTVNRILVMAILVKYLNDRKDPAGNGVFKAGFFKQFSHVPVEDIDLAALFREKGSCVRLFDHLSEHFNGGIFVLSEAEKAELSQADLYRIADFLKGDQDPCGQGLFWPLYSFEDLPVELISNIYEEFLAKKDKGVVYTPPMLVDFLLDQCLPLEAGTISWKILDPACGSGVFLVGAFKRLIHCWRMANDWKQPSYRDLQGILKDSIFGFDKSSEAVLVTAFSLCVALCDELEPLIIWNKLKFDNLQQRNLLTRDFFEVVESEEFAGHFDMVIGNPPFESKLTTDAAKRVEAASICKTRPKLPDTQLALLFLEQSFRMVKEGAKVCLIQPAGPLLYNSKALQFRGYLFDKFAINQVFDFTPLEGILFPNAQVAAAAFVGYNTSPSTDKIQHITFRRTRAIKEKLLFELDPYEFHWIPRKNIATNQYAWKANLLGGGRLHRLLDRFLNEFSTLGDYLTLKKNAGWQFGEGYCGSKLNNLPNVKDLIHLTPEEIALLKYSKKVPELAPWITGKLKVPSESLSQKGICWDDVHKCEEYFYDWPRRKTRQIFIPPHVLIREIVDGVAIPAIYLEKEELVFTNQIIGIHAPEHDKEHLEKIANNLNESKLYGVLASILSGRILVSKHNSLYVTDIMSLPYPDDSQEIKLCDWEQALIDDIGNYLIDFRRKGEKASILHKTNALDLRCFGEMYCNILNPVYKQFRPLDPIPMNAFICYPFCYGETPRIELPKKDTVIPYLDELLHRQHGSRLFINRILRIYEQNVVFMIKPNQKRYWLRSIALRDADETLVDLLGQGY